MSKIKMFGGRVDAHDVHYSGLTWEFLANFLARAGFRDIKRAEEFNEFKDASSLRFGNVLISLNIEQPAGHAHGIPCRPPKLPQRMGAALTYARRYALFTLVGRRSPPCGSLRPFCSDSRSSASRVRLSLPGPKTLHVR